MVVVSSLLCSDTPVNTCLQKDTWLLLFSHSVTSYTWRRPFLALWVFFCTYINGTKKTCVREKGLRLKRANKQTKKKKIGGRRETWRKTTIGKIDRGDAPALGWRARGLCRLRGCEERKVESEHPPPLTSAPLLSLPLTVELYAWLLLLSLAFLPILFQSLGEDRGRQQGLS